MKYGVISDIHKDPRIAYLAIDVLKSKGVEKLLVNGDIGDRQQTLEDTQRYTATILDAIGKSGLEAFVQPGSHETIEGYRSVLSYFADKYSNVFDVQKIGHVEADGHQLVFLPGSDFVAGGEYRIGSGKLSSGDYFVDIHNEFVDPSDEKEIQRLSELGKLSGVTHFQNMNDLKSVIKDPSKTIVVCHVPRKFDNLEVAVDMAEFGEATQDFNFKGGNVEKGSIFPLYMAKPISEARYPVKLKKENRGNEDLKNLYEEIGITNAVTGHFHESGHRANDKSGNHVKEGEIVSDLFWNSGHLDVGQTGILTVKGDKVSYENIRLQNYINQ